MTSSPDSTPVRRVHVALSLDHATRAQLTQRLEAARHEVVFTRDRDELMAVLSEVEYLLVGRPPRLDWGSAQRLRLIHVAGAGVDPLFPAQGLGPEVVISNCKGAHADEVRDHVLGLMFHFAREFAHAFEAQAQRVWSPRPARSLAGQRLCVVGLGEVGRRVARAASALGLSVVGVRRSRTPVEGVYQVYDPSGLRLAVSDADYVVLCAPLTAQTYRMFDCHVLEGLAAHAVLINVGRGALIDEVALEERLRAGQLRGAALDVFEREPLDLTSSLWDCPGLVITPHIAGYTPNYFEPVANSFIDAVERVARGQLPLTVVSREHEY